MIHYWWLFVLGLTVGFILGVTIISEGSKRAVKDVMWLREENDRLYRRIEMIGERTQDGGIQI